MLDTTYFEFCESDTQKEILAAVLQEGSSSKAAKALRKNKSNINRAIARIKRNASKRGYAPEFDLVHPVAKSQLLKGTSTLYGEEGEKRLQWVKTSPQVELAEDLLRVLEDYEYKPAPKTKLSRGHQESDLCSLYTITDFHLGMYAWAGETGEDWDTEIAQEVMVNAITDMIASAPNSELGILNIQGDFLHWDGLDAVTPMNKHVLDADTRFSKMIELAIDLVAWAAIALSEKHKKVKVIICEGNHDLAGSAWLRKCILKIMASNPRIEVDDTNFPYYAHLHGTTLLGFHHGHKKANKSLPSLFASEPRYRGMWGKAKYCYIHSGHYHKRESDEDNGAVVERHPTLAARDAYAARGGYVSNSGACVITYSKTAGEVIRHWVLPRYVT